MSPTEIVALNLACALIGFLLGNWLTIGRDRRKEFNVLVDPIRKSLLIIRNSPSAYLTGEWMITFTLIREQLPFWKRKGFDMAIENYKKSKGADNQERTATGGFIYRDKEMIIHAVNGLLKYLKPR